MTRHILGRLFLAALLTAVLGVPAFADFKDTGPTTLSVTIGAEASIEVTDSTTELKSTGTLFSDFGGTTKFKYKIRTSKSSTGDITVALTEFPAGGPSVGNPTAGDELTYICKISDPGKPCADNTQAKLTATNVAGFGSNAHSAKAGNDGAVTWKLPNDPLYEAGTYTSTATFSISAH
jgi:hypothetical protein